MINGNTGTVAQEQLGKRNTPLGYKIAIACIIVAAGVLLTSFGYSILRVILNENASINFFTVLLCWAVVPPVAVLVLDFITLRKDRWWVWSLVSLGLKGWDLLTLIPTFIYVINRMLIYPDSYYSSLISYLFRFGLMLIMIYPSIYNLWRIYQMKKINKKEGKKEGIFTKKKSSPFDVFSVIGITVGFVGTLQFLISGVASIGADGYAKLGVIFILPALMGFTVVLLDFLALRGTKWLAWSIVGLAAKGCLVLTLLGNIVELIVRMLSGKSYSNLSFYVLLLILAALIIYPSVRNIININRQREQQRIAGTLHQQGTPMSPQYSSNGNNVYMPEQEVVGETQTTNTTDVVASPTEQTE